MPGFIRLLQGLIVFVDGLNEAVGRLVSWLTLGMVVITFLIVVLRYLFNTGWIAMQESLLYMHAAVFLLGAAFTLRRHGHVRVDIFYRKLSPRRRAWVDLAGSVLFLLPVSAFIVYMSWDYVATSWSLKESSGEAGGLPWVYLLKSGIIALGVTLLLQGIAEFLRSLLVALGLAEPSSDGEPREV